MKHRYRYVYIETGLGTLQMIEEQNPQQADQELLKIWLKDRDAFCPACGYNLRDLLSDYCPECGRRVFLRVGAAQTGFGWFLAMIAPLLIVGGFGCFIMLFAIGEGMPPFPKYWYIWLFVFISPSELLLALILILLRRWFFRMQSSSQRIWALLSWGGNLVLILIFLSMIA